MTTFRRGDVVLVVYPNSDLSTYKRRPVLVVQADDLDTGLPQVAVAMISSNLSRGGHPSRVAILADTEAHRQSGLLMDSVVLTDNLATILDSEIERKLGFIEDMSAVDQALRTTLGL